MFIPALTFVLISLGIFGGTVNLYKYANKKYNGSFRLTNSRTWALYGNTARRMKNLSFKEYLTAMTMVPGTQACYAFFKPQECLYWSYEESDTLGMNKLRELSAQADSPQKTDQTLIALSIQEAMKNPFQYFFLFALEGLKIFFWEFPAMQYFYYPDFILKIYRFEAFFKGLYFGMPFLTVTSFVWSLFLLRRKRRNLFNTKENESSLTLICVIGFIGIYTFLHSFFLIIPRYALPLVPLYLILIAFLLNSIFFRKKNPT